MKHLPALVAAFGAGALATVAAGVPLVRYLAHNEAFGVLNRKAGRLALAVARTPCDVVYCDLNNLHLLNRLGEERIDGLVRTAFAVRHQRGRRPDVVTQVRVGAQYRSGDEFVFLTAPGDGAGLARRLEAALHNAPLTEAERHQLARWSGGRLVGLSAAWGVATCARRSDLVRAVDTAIAVAKAAKATRPAIERNGHGQG